MINVSASKKEFLSKLLLKLDDMVNPIVVKEVRQSVNSNGLIVTTVLVLLLEVCAFLFNLFFQDFNFGTGTSFFLLILGIFVAGYCFGIGGNVAIRMMKEHRNINSTDLIYTTTINPYRIVWGKVFSAMVMVSYLYSLCLPFMCISYFLKGISLNTIILGSLFAFILAIPFMLSIIFITAIPMSNLLKIFLLIGVIGAMWSVIGWGMAIISEPASFRSVINGHILETVSVIFFWLLALSGLFYFLTVGLLSHLTSNRTVGLKIYYIVLLLASAALFVVVNLFIPAGAKLPVLAYYIFAMMVIYGILIFNCFERIEQTKRVLATVPKNFILRIWHFLFSTGMTNNICYLLIVFFLVNVVCLLLDSIIPHTNKADVLSHDNYLMMRRFIGVFCYLLSYQLFGVFVKWITKNYFERVSVFAYVLLIVMLSFLIPILIGVVLADFNVEKLGRQSEYIYILNPLIFDKSKYVNAGLMAGISFVLLGILLNGYFFIKNLIIGFSYHKKEAVVVEND